MTQQSVYFGFIRCKKKICWEMNYQLRTIFSRKMCRRNVHYLRLSPKGRDVAMPMLPMRFSHQLVKIHGQIPFLFSYSFYVSHKNTTLFNDFWIVKHMTVNCLGLMNNFLIFALKLCWNHLLMLLSPFIIKWLELNVDIVDHVKIRIK